MTFIDYFIIGAYMLGILAVGLLSKGKEDSAEDYFAAGGRMGGLLSTVIVGLSIAATFFSGLSFVAVPSIIISDGLKVTLVLVTLPISSWIVCGWFIPRYLALKTLHPYEIIRRHIGSRASNVTSALFVLLRVGWMAALLYAPTILLLTTMRLGDQWLWPLILVMGLGTTVDTVLGGLQSVLITDAVQMIIVIASLIVTVVCGIMQLPPEPGQWIQVLSEGGKLEWPSFSLDMTERFTIFGILIGITVTNLGNYIGDQMSLQRYLAMKDVRSAQQSFRFNMWGTALSLVLLYLLGCVIVVWQGFHSAGGAGVPADQVFPNFVAQALPPGVCGLMVAAILAATMDSVASGVNALAGSITIDFVRPNCRSLSDQSLVKIGKRISLAVGVGATLVAGFISKVGSIYDMMQAILGVFLGPILGVMILAMLRWMVSENRVLAGIGIGCACGIAVTFTPIQSIWTTSFGFFSCLLVAWPYGRQLRSPEKTTS